MAVTRFGVGTVASAASGNITPTLPAGFATNDVGILVCAQHDNVVASISGSWNIVDAANNTTALRGWWAWKRLTAGEGNPTITHAAGDAIIARITVFSGVRTSGNPHDVASANSHAASATMTATAISPGTAGSRIVFMSTNSDDCTFSAYSGTNPTLSSAEDIDNLTSLGADASIAMASGDKTDTTTTGSRTATASRSSGLGRNFLIALVPDSSPPQTWTGSAATATIAGSSGSFVPGAVTWSGSAATVTVSATSGSFAGSGGGQTWTGSSATVSVAATSGSFVPGTKVWTGSSATVSVSASSGSFAPGAKAWTGSSATATIAATSGSFVPGSRAWTGSSASVSVAATSGVFAPQPVIWTGSTGAVTVLAVSGSFAGSGGDPQTWTGSTVTVGIAGTSGTFVPGTATWAGSVGLLTFTATSGVWGIEVDSAPHPEYTVAAPVDAPQRAASPSALATGRPSSVVAGRAPVLTTTPPTTPIGGD